MHGRGPIAGVVALGFAAVTVAFLYPVPRENRAPLVSSAAAAAVSAHAPLPDSAQEFIGAITPDVDDIALDALLAECPGRASVIIESADGSWRLDRNGDRVVRSASVIKLPILLSLYALRRRGIIDLRDSVTVIPDDRTSGSGNLKHRAFPFRASMDELMTAMITISDNTATNTIIRIVGVDTLAAAFRDLGLDRTTLERRVLEDVRDNPATAAEITSLLRALAVRTAIPVAGTAAYLADADAIHARTLLAHASNRGRLGRYLPEETIIEHKTGTLDGIVHDAGIIRTPGGDVIVAGFVSDTRDKNAAERWLGKLGLLAAGLKADTRAQDP